MLEHASTVLEQHAIVAGVKAPERMSATERSPLAQQAVAPPTRRKRRGTRRERVLRGWGPRRRTRVKQHGREFHDQRGAPCRACCARTSKGGWRQCSNIYSPRCSRAGTWLRHLLSAPQGAPQ
eukprot:3347449-Pleurochrysis_carterae.AAC.1